MTATPPAHGSARHEAVMFTLAVVFLLILAGVIHRAVSLPSDDPEVRAMYAGLIALWPVFAVEAVFGVLRKGPERKWSPVVWRAVLILCLPPYRIARSHPRTGLVWFPRLGWVPTGKATFDRLDRGFGTPMLFVAILILPVLIIEYTKRDLVDSTPALKLALDIGTAVIWVAFALEFLVESSVAPKTGKYLKEKWLDAAIVILPMLEFIMTRLVDAAPLARLLRLGRAINPEQLARMQRLYRLRGLLTKAWAAFLLLGGMNRIFGQSPEKRLKIVSAKIADLEEELTTLTAEAVVLRSKIAAAEADDAAAEAEQGLRDHPCG